MTSSLLGVFLSVGSDCEEGKARRRENSRYKNTLYGRSGMEGRYDVWSRGKVQFKESRRSCRYSGGSHEMRRETSARVYGNDPES